MISSASLAGLAVALLVTLAQPQSWFSQEWPEERVEAVREATRDPSVRLWATDGTANWLLWRIPDLRGRIAYDVRFELYDERRSTRTSRYGPARRGGLEVSGRRLRSRRHRRCRAPKERLHPSADPPFVFRDDEIAVVSRKADQRP